MSVVVMSKVWELDLPHNEAFVLLALADHADDQGGSIFPSLQRIAWKTGYSKRAVWTIMKRLEGAGILCQVDGPRQHRPPTYEIDFERAPRKAPFRVAETSTLEPARVAETSTLDGSYRVPGWQSKTSRVAVCDTRVAIHDARVEVATATYPSSEPSEKTLREPSTHARATLSSLEACSARSDPEEARKKKELSAYRNKMAKSGLYSSDELLSLKDKCIEQLMEIDMVRLLDVNPHFRGANGKAG